MKKIRVAIIGPGEFARVCHIPGIRLHPDAVVAAVCGRDAGRSARFAAQEGIPLSFTNVDSMFDADICDAVAIATPDASHHEFSLKALSRGKHVFCEKPLAMNATQSAEMVAAAETSGAINMVAFTFRYMHALREMRRLIREGLIGTPFHISLQVYWGDDLEPKSLSWRDQSEYSAAGIWGDAGSHLFDAVSYLFKPVSEVYAQLNVIRREAGFPQPGSVDLAACLAQTRYVHAGIDSGVSVELHASRVSRPRGLTHELQVLGTKASLGMPLTRGNNEYLSFLPAGSSNWENFPLPADAYTNEARALQRMMLAFVTAIANGVANPAQDARFIDGHYAQLAIDAGLRSVESKRAEIVNYELN